MKLQLILIVLTFSYVILIGFHDLAHANPSILIEFLYYDRLCPDCPGQEIYYEVYIHNSNVVDNVERDYEEVIQVKRIYWNSQEGWAKRELYQLSPLDWNTIIVNEEVVLKGGDQFVDEIHLRQIIDNYLTREHDVAVLDAIVNPRTILKGEILNINVTVTNKGKQPESFNMTISLNSTIVAELCVMLLEPNTNRTISFYLNTTEFSEGYYFLRIHSLPVQNEVNISDNVYNAGMIEVKVSNTSLTYIRDIAVSSLISSKSRATNHERINVTVIVKNLGSVIENFTLRIFLNESFITEMDIVNLNPGSNIFKIFTVNLTDLLPGDYILKASVVLESDLNQENNELSCVISILNPFNESDGIFYISNVLLAFVFGFFETFSPCLIVLLSFVITYTVGETMSFKESFTKVIAFGVGFLSSAVLFSAVAIIFFFSIPFQDLMSFIICVFAIFFGLNIMGLNITRFFKKQNGVKSLIQKLAKKYAKTYVGIIVLGFLFYFLDPCVAPFFFAVIPLVMNVNFTLIVLAFCFGVMLPFVIIGVVTGSISKLVRSIYKHRSKLHMISGSLLVCYSIYLMIHLIF